ncbi:MAG TPA: Gfo/Idh/MocA family oxidoreductase [Novosphingobium sp.]|nr:Gfo/Idh/MocA family oxidoreductase [Novosphingobium sp.]
MPIALVGYGKIASDQHERAIATTTSFALAAVVDPVARHPSLNSFADVEALLRQRPDIPALALCQPPRFRLEAGLAALRAGRHVLLEKPPGLDLAQVHQLAMLAAERGLALYTAWHSQMGAAIDPARQWLAGQAIRHVAVTWCEDVRRWHPGQHWIMQEGGFGVFDPVINAFSILTALLPGPLAVEAARLDVPANCGAPIAGAVALRAADGVGIALEMDFLKQGEQIWDIAIETDAGTLVIGGHGNTLSLDGVAMPVPQEAEYRRLYDRFAQLIASGQSEVDVEPLRLACNALATGERRPVADFHF